MGEEGDLREQYAERRSDQQLEPAVAQQDEAGDAPGKAEGDQCSDERVEPGRAAEQSRLADDLRQIGERPRDRGEVCGAGVGLTNGAESRLGDEGSDGVAT